MSVRKLLVLTLTVACVIMSYATPMFTTKRLAAIASSAGLNLPAILGCEIDNDTTWTFKDRQIRICTNIFGEVSHVGYKMFDSSLISSYNPKDILLFIERYALELDLKIDKRDALTRMAVDKVVCGEGNVAMLAKVTPQTSFSIEEMERRMYRMKWNIDGKVLSLTIPADCQLIIGADAVELEDIFERNLKRMQTKSNFDVEDAFYKGKKYRLRDLSIIDGGEYLSKLIRGDLYINEKDDKKSVMIDYRKPVQTVSNILITGVFDREIPMCLIFNRYGYRSTQMNVTLQQFVNLCYAEDCKLYVGIKNYDKENVSATVFALNNKLAYNHVLSVNFPLVILDGGDGKVEATVYAYIPLQNVTEKFFIQDLGNIKLNMK